MKVKSEREVAQSCPTLGDPMDCSLPGSSVHGIFQARGLEWGAIAFSSMFTSTAQFYFGVNKLTKGVWCYINEAAFLEASFPREEREINKENKLFSSEEFGAYNCNNYPKLTCLGASIMQSWSLFKAQCFMLAVNLTDTLTYPSVNSSSIPLSTYIYYLVIHPSIHPSIYPAFIHWSRNH